MPVLGGIAIRQSAASVELLTLHNEGLKKSMHKPHFHVQCVRNHKIRFTSKRNFVLNTLHEVVANV